MGGGIAAFAASACDSCHGFPPVARNVGYAINSNIGRMNNYTGAKFEDYSGGGGAHSVAAHLPATIKPADGFNACATCHNLGATGHVGSTPVKSNIGNVSVKLTQTKRFAAGTQSIYSSAKFVSPPNNKSGTCFNLNCHIGKSLKWSTEK
jgi:cytochrome c553